MQEKGTTRELNSSDGDFSQSCDSFPAQHDYSDYQYRSPLWIPPDQRGPVLFPPPTDYTIPQHTKKQPSLRLVIPPPPIDAAPRPHDSMPLPLFKDNLIIPQPIKIYWEDKKLSNAIHGSQEQLNSQRQ